MPMEIRLSGTTSCCRNDAEKLPDAAGNRQAGIAEPDLNLLCNQTRKLARVPCRNDFHLRLTFSIEMCIVYTHAYRKGASESGQSSVSDPR